MVDPFKVEILVAGNGVRVARSLGLDLIMVERDERGFFESFDCNY